MPASAARSLLCLVLWALAGSAPLAAGLTVSGTVLGPDRRPFSGAQVELLPVLGNFEAGRLRLAGEGEPAPAAEAQSDAFGSFALRAPAVGVFRVVVRGPGQVPMQHTPLLLAEDEALVPVVLSADVGARLRVTDAAGRPLAGAWVFATGAEERGPGGRIAQAWRSDFRIGRTGADGSLLLPRRSGERLDVSVFPPGGAEETRRELEGGTIAVPERGLASRRLRVVTPRGEPVEGVLVRSGDLSWPVGLTDAEGRLRIPGRPGEPARLRLIAGDSRQRVLEMQAPNPGDPETVVELADPVTVVGRVLAAVGSRPLPGALIQVSADPETFLKTDEAGRFRLVAADPEGFQLQALAPGYLPKAARVTKAHVRSGRAPAMLLEAAAVLRGQALDARGAPLPGVVLAAVPEPSPGLPGAVVDRTSSDATGRFELRRMHAGRGYTLQAVLRGYLPAAIQAVVPALSAREVPPLQIVLTPARAAQGRVQDASGRPVAGAEIFLTASRELGRPVHSREPPGEPGLRADEKGRFTIAQIPANPLDLMVRKRGFAPALVRGIRVPPGAGAADLGVVVLQPGARLTGRVTDRDNRAVAGAEVFRVEDLKRVEEMGARLDGDRADAVTGPDGRFVLEDLPAQSPENLLVRARGYLPAGVRGVRAPSREPVVVRLEAATLLRGQVMDEARQPVAGARLELVLGERHSVIRLAVSGRDGGFEFLDVPRGSGALSVQAQGFVFVEDMAVTLPRPEPGGELILTLEKGAVLTGRVSLTDGTPVPGARVSVAGSAALSDDEGAYAAEGVAPGPVVVQVFHPSYRRFSKEMVIEPGGNQFDVTFEPGVEVTGRVIDEQGAPVPGARVQLGSQERGELEYRAHTATDGSFRLSPVARGRYRLRAAHEDYPPAELKRSVEVADEPVGGIDIELRQGGAILGRVLGLKPEELAEVYVEAEQAGKTHPASLDFKGRYAIRHLRTGDYLVRASLVAGQRQAQARVSLEPGQREVTRDLEFRRRLTLSGQVLYGEDPLPEAALAVRGNRFAVERSVVTDHQGGFRFEDLDPDVYALGLSHASERLVHNENVELAGDREIVIRLRPATVSGLVKDGKSGSPVPGALVLLRHAAGAEGPEFLVSGGTGQDGSFLLSRVPPGSYQMTVSAEGYAPGKQEVTVPAGQDRAGLEVALEPTLGLDLTVRLASGKAPGLVHVRVLSPSGASVVAETRSPEPSGALRLPTVPIGSWQLLLSAPGGALAGSPVTVPGEAKALTLPAAGRLQVRVPALASSDLIAVLTLRGSDQQPFWTLGPGGTIQELWPLIGGNATVEGLPAGLWEVRVAVPDGQTWTGSVATSGASDAGIVLE